MQPSNAQERYIALAEWIKWLPRKLGLRNLPLTMALKRGHVLNGPFKGMQLTFDPDYITRPKILGTFEKELHSSIESILRSLKPPCVIYNIGAAEGYYTMGFALRLPHARIITWEADQPTQALLQKNIRKNGLAARVEIRGKCTPTELLQVARSAQPDLVVCDIEGGELSLLNKEILCAMTSSAFIVETHSPSITQNIENLFLQTHLVELFRPISRTLQDWSLPAYIFCSDAVKLASMNEWRKKETPWIIARPKSSDPYQSI
jgi:hypothetical protein